MRQRTARHEAGEHGGSERRAQMHSLSLLGAGVLENNSVRPGSSCRSRSMRSRQTKRATSVGIGVALGLLVGLPTVARAQSMVAYAEPPPGRTVPYTEPDDRPVVAQPAPYGDRPYAGSSWSNWDRERSPVRLTVGPQSSFSNHGAHFGALAGLDFGRDRLGGRIAASWARGLETPGSGGSSLSQFGGELTLDLAKRGMLHPVFGLGLAVLYVEHGDIKAFAGAGTLRAGLEVPLPVHEADVRIGLSAQGGLIGPSDERLERMRGIGNVLATFSLGF